MENNREVVGTAVEMEKEMSTEVEKKQPRAVAPAVTKLGASVDDGNDLIVAEMPVANQRAEITRMERAIRGGEICYGKVIGVEVGDRNDVRIVVKRDTLRVVIPAEDFFAHSVMKDIYISLMTGLPAMLFYTIHIKKSFHL